MTSINSKESEFFEIKKLEYKGISIFVRLAYEDRTISFIEKIPYVGSNHPYKSEWTSKKKEWVFADRGPEYMDGWCDILDAMKYAAGWAKRKFAEYDKKVAAEAQATQFEKEEKVLGMIVNLKKPARNRFKNLK